MSKLEDKKSPIDKGLTKRPDESSDKSSPNASGASFLIMVQFLTKLLTFTLNQMLIRFISPTIFGISTYLEFLLSTVLFFSREGVRLSIQRTESKNGKEETLQSIVNFGWLPMIVGTPLAFAIFYWQYQTVLFQQTILNLSYYKLTMLLLAILIVLEWITEPIYAIYQYQLNFKLRSKFESLAIFNRCVATFGVIMGAKYTELFLESDGLAVLAFAVGQFSYSFTICVFYFWSFYSNFDKVSLFPSLIHGLSPYYFDPKVLVVWKSLFIQMIFKQFLTEGDKLLINYLCTVEEQGVYSVVANYGSMVARLLFQPIEEYTRLLFTRLLVLDSDDNISNAYYFLQNLSIFYWNLVTLILLAGYTNASFLLRIMLGGSVSKWETTDIFQVFPQYVAYIPLLAFNGIFEAFFSSIATSSDIKRFSYFMTFLSVVVLASLYVFIHNLKLGLGGLILSNSINMLLRIAYCAIAIKNYFARFKIILTFTGVLNYLKSSIFVVSVFELIHYKFIFRSQTVFTTTFTQFFKSFIVCVVCALGLLILERNRLKTPVISLTNRLLKRKHE